MAEIIATYSIAACDLEAGQWGVATQSKFLAVGSVVPWAVPGVGAVATQAYANPRYGPQGLQLLAEGFSAAEVVARLTDADDGRADLAVGVVDARGGGASYTGSGCMEWAGGLAGPGFAAQGNILVGEETVAALATTFTATDGQPLAERLPVSGGERRRERSDCLLADEDVPLRGEAGPREAAGPFHAAGARVARAAAPGVDNADLAVCAALVRVG